MGLGEAQPACISACNSLWVSDLLGTSVEEPKALGSCAPALSSTASRQRKVSVAALSRAFMAVTKSAERRERKGSMASVVLVI
jgi:hypothetical protein